MLGPPVDDPLENRPTRSSDTSSDSTEDSHWHLRLESNVITCRTNPNDTIEIHEIQVDTAAQV